MNLKYKELRREAPTRHIMESKHTEAAPPEGRRTAVLKVLGGASLFFSENSDFKFNFSIISKLSINTFRYQVLQLITGLG